MCRLNVRKTSCALLSVLVGNPLSTASILWTWLVLNEKLIFDIFGTLKTLARPLQWLLFDIEFTLILSVPILKTVLAQQPSLWVRARLIVSRPPKSVLVIRYSIRLTLLTFPTLTLSDESILCKWVTRLLPSFRNSRTGRKCLIDLIDTFPLTNLPPIPLRLTPLTPLTVIATLITWLVLLTNLVTLVRTPWPPTPTLILILKCANIWLTTLITLVLQSNELEFIILVLYRKNLWQ